MPEPPDAYKERGYVVAHVPEDAELWIGDTRLAERGTVRTFATPKLAKGRDYFYDVRVVWNEDGHRVSQVRHVNVHAGECHCVDLIKADSEPALTESKESLLRLSPNDRKLAEQQKFCAVMSKTRLGTMGVPVKVTLNGKPVFLCCDGCVSVAKENPETTLEKAAKLSERPK